MSEMFAMKGAKYWITPPRTAVTTSLITLGGAKVFMHQW